MSCVDEADIWTENTHGVPARAAPCIAILGSDQFREQWRAALPSGTPIVALNDACALIAEGDRWTSPPLIVVVDDSTRDADETVARLIESVPAAVMVVVSAEMTHQRARWIESGQVVLLPPGRGGTVYLPLGRCLVEHLAILVAAQWSRRTTRGRRHLGGLLWLDEASRAIVDGDRQIFLMTGEFVALRYLCENLGEWIPTRVVSAEALGRRDQAGHKLVWKYISGLREKLAGTGVVIDNERVRGYRARLLHESTNHSEHVVNMSRPISSDSAADTARSRFR